MPRKPSPHSLVVQADRLSLSDLKQLVAYLSQQIQDRELTTSDDRQPLKRVGDRSIVSAGNLTAVAPMIFRSMVPIGIDR